MNATATGGLVFALTMAGILFGFWLRTRLPARHLDNDTQSSVKDVNGLIGTMTALVQGLAAQTPNQQWLKARALELTESLLAARWGIVAGRASPIPTAFFVIIAFWLAATFASYALFAPRNGTISVTLVISAFLVASVVFLILELGNPFDGWIVVSAEPVSFALEQPGK
jgi:hypothetical protein